MRHSTCREWQQEFDVAQAVLKTDPGTLEWATDANVAFRYIEATVRIVFYPHRTGAGHYHLRIRDEASKDKARFKELGRRLDVGAGLSCTFRQKNTGFNFQKPGDDHGWAAKEALGRDWI